MRPYTPSAYLCVSTPKSKYLIAEAADDRRGSGRCGTDQEFSVSHQECHWHGTRRVNAGFIDQVFLGQQQVKKAQEEGNSLNSVAKDMIDAELAREATQQLSANMRFGSGPGTHRRTLPSRQTQETSESTSSQGKEQIQIVIVLAILGIATAAMIGGLAWYYIEVR